MSESDQFLKPMLLKAVASAALVSGLTARVDGIIKTGRRKNLKQSKLFPGNAVYFLRLSSSSAMIFLKLLESGDFSNEVPRY